MITRPLYPRLYGAINRRLASIAGGRFIRWVGPTSIALLLTKRCNARCVHCDIWRNRQKDETTTAEQWKRLLSDLRHWLGPVQVTLTGGEALLKPGATELVADGSSIGLAVELLTNGYWREQTRIEELARANPWRVTVSLDAVGETHSRIRGRDDFWTWTAHSIETLRRLREQERLKYRILLKTVIMAQNLDEVVGVARFAADKGVEVFYQPIEQNYDTKDDPAWFAEASTWPKDSGKAVGVVEELTALKKDGLPIANDDRELAAMIPYFRDPVSCQEAVRSHSAHETRASCAAVSMLQVEPNGDVLVCYRMPSIGDFRARGIRDIWNARPRWWDQGCSCRCPLLPDTTASRSADFVASATMAKDDGAGEVGDERT